MRLKLSSLAFSLLAVLVAPSLAQRPPGADLPPPVTVITSDAMERSYFQAYCMTCHQGTAAPAGMRIDRLDTAHVEKDAEKWEKIVWKVRAGMMPPAGRPRPDAKTLRR